MLYKDRLFVVPFYDVHRARRRIFEQQVISFVISQSHHMHGAGRGLSFGGAVVQAKSAFGL